jgi:hypothetical protein
MSRALAAPVDNAHYVKATLPAIGAVRVEMRIRALIDSTGGNRTLFRTPIGGLTITDAATFISWSSFKAGEAGAIGFAIKDPVFPNTGGVGLPRYLECLVRFQFDPVALRYSVEIWNLLGTDRLVGTQQNGVGGAVVTAANIDAGDWGFGNAGFGADRLGGSIDWIRLYNTVLPLNSAAPVMAPPLAAVVHHAWELEDSLADTVVAGGIPLTWVGGGTPTYEDAIEAPTAAPVLSSATYSTVPDRVDLVFTDPNAAGANEATVDVERRIGTTGDWKRLGFTVAADATGYADTQIAHAVTYNYRVKARNRLGSSAYSNIVAVTTGAGTDTNPTVTENAKVGTAAWTLTNPAIAREIEGYADQVSVNRGGTINLKVSSTQNFNLEVFRIGWYGGLGARRIRNVLAIAGVVQADPTETGTAPAFNYECNWTTSHALATTDADPTEWPSGMYLVRLTQVTSGKQSYIRFVVRDDARRSELYVNDPVLTDTAYNAWPCSGNGNGNMTGRSAYRGPGGVVSAQVCLNRPYGVPTRPDANYGTGAGDFVVQHAVGTGNPRGAGSMINWVRWLEKEGVDVQYGTDLDLHTQQDKIWARCFGMVFPGHQEYVTWQMRATVIAARDYGRHLSFQGANAYYWPVRLQAGPVTGRTNGQVVAWKDNPSDPYALAPAPISNFRYSTSARWRTFGDNPVPEASFIGVQYVGDPADADLTITAAGAAHALMAGTGFAPGSTVPGMVGYEFDQSFGVEPAGTVFLAHTANVQTGQHHDMSVYTHASGAVVFGAGTMQLIWAADDFGVAEGGRISRLSAGVTTFLRNLMGVQRVPTIAEAGSVGGPGVPAKLIMVQQPAGAPAGSEMPTPPIVAVADAAGTIVPGADVRISCAIQSGLGILTGPDFKDTTPDGKGNFQGLAFWGSAPLVLRFTAPGLASVDAAAFTPLAQTGTFDGICELPRVTPNPATPTVFAATTTVSTVAALQAAIDTYAAILDGQAREIRIADGLALDNVALADSVKLRTHTGVSAGIIVIRLNTLPVNVPRRVQPADFDGLTSLSTMTGRGFFATEHNADNYHLVGLHIFQGADGNENTGVVELGDDGSLGQINDTFCPSGIVLDRCWIHGDPAGLCHRAIAQNAKLVTVRYSRLSDCHVNGGYGDANALQMWNTPGGLYVYDSYLEGGDECLIVGGGSPWDESLHPADITLRKCHLGRPKSWKGVWNVKNILDWKNGKRTLIEGCVAENNWASGQDGMALVFKSNDQDNTQPLSGTRDFTLRNFALRNTGGGITFAGHPEAYEVVRSHRMQAYNIVLWNVNTADYDGTGEFFRHANDGHDWSTRHLTFVGGPNDAGGFSVKGTGDPGQHVNRWDMTDSIFARLAGLNYGVVYDGFDPAGVVAFGQMSPLGALARNVFAGLNGNPADYSPNFVAADAAAVGFVNLPGAAALFELGDPSVILPLLKLANTSPYKGLGLAGTDPGADIDAILAAIAGAWVAGEIDGGAAPVVPVATALGMVTQPAGAVAGSPFLTQPRVEVLDQFGARLVTSTAVITANLFSGTGALIGTVAVAAVAGLSAWINLGGDMAGVKVIRFTSPGLSPVDSAPVTVTAPADPGGFTWVSGRRGSPSCGIRSSRAIPSPPRRVQLLGADGTPQQLPPERGALHAARSGWQRHPPSRAVHDRDGEWRPVAYEYQPADTAEFGLCTDEFEVTGPGPTTMKCSRSRIPRTAS